MAPGTPDIVVIVMCMYSNSCCIYSTTGMAGYKRRRWVLSMDKPVYMSLRSLNQDHWKAANSSIHIMTVMSLTLK